MRDQRNHDDSKPDYWADHRVLLDLLISSHPAQWTVPELARVLCPSAEGRLGGEPSPVDVEDALAELYAAGLIHRVGQFAFASRTAVEANRLSA